MKKIFTLFSFIMLIYSSVEASIVKFSSDSDTKLRQSVLKQSHLHQIDSLQNYFINNGYLDVVLSEKADTIFVKTNNQYKLRMIYINSVDSIKYTQIYFTKNAIENVFESILKDYQTLGYQFANVIIDSTVTLNAQADIYCTLIEGPKVSFDKIVFSGLTRTKESLLQPYFTFDDSTITPNLLSEIEQIAQSIPYADFIQPIKQELNQGYNSSQLILQFQEKSNIQFEGGGGYLSENDLFIWNLSLKFQNIFGGGQDISVLSQKKDIDNQQLQVGYSQPLFLFGLGRADIEVKTRDYRSEFYEFILLSGFESYDRRNLYIGLSGQYKSVELDASNSSYNSGEIAISVSNSNKIEQYSSKHFIYKSQFSYGRRKYRSDTLDTTPFQGSYNESRIDILTQSRLKIKKLLHLSSQLHFQNFQTDENLPPLSELFLIGGPGIIRGYKDEQFVSIRNLTFTFEPYLNFESANLFFFYDGGYLFNRIPSEIKAYDESTIYRYGYGFGLSLIENNRAFKISFGWNKNLPFDNPYISLQLKTNL